MADGLVSCGSALASVVWSRSQLLLTLSPLSWVGDGLDCIVRMVAGCDGCGAD